MSLPDNPSYPVELTDADFDSAVKKYKLLVVDFWAPWCPPCLMMAPVIENLAKKFEGKIVFGKINVDENQQKASFFGIMSIPTLLIFKEEKIQEKIVGALPEELLENKLKKYIEE